MANKAHLFRDKVARLQIMASADPQQRNCLGRGVHNIGHSTWENQHESIFLRGTYAKRSQNQPFQDALLTTGTCPLAEASPHYPLWGTGLRADYSRCAEPLPMTQH